MFGFLKGLAAKAAGAGLVGTFNSDLSELKKAPPEVQKQVAQRVLKEIQPFLQVGNEAFANAMLPTLARAATERRHAALAAGATSGRDPAYAEAALLEAWFLATISRNQSVFGPINESLVNWLHSTGVK